MAANSTIYFFDATTFIADVSAIYQNENYVLVGSARPLSTFTPGIRYGVNNYSSTKTPFTDISGKIIAFGPNASIFSNLVGLTSITIPVNVSQTGSNGLTNCANLTSVNIQGQAFIDAIVNNTSINNMGTTNDYDNVSISTINPRAINVTLGRNVTRIPPYYFSKSPTTISVTAPSVTSIGAYAFNLMSNFTTFTGTSVINIGDYAFNRCYNLSQFNMQTSVGSNAFPSRIGNYAFYNCPSLNTINIPDCVTSIGDNAFATYNRDITRAWSTDLKSVIINDQSSNLLSIGYRAFYISGITSFTVPISLIYINKDAFRLCIYLTSVLFPRSLTYNLKNIDDYAFYSCPTLSDFYLDNPNYSQAFTSLTNIGYNCFGGSVSITNFVFPINITKYVDFGLGGNRNMSVRIESQALVDSSNNSSSGVAGGIFLSAMFRYGITNQNSGVTFNSITFGTYVTKIPDNYFDGFYSAGQVQDPPFSFSVTAPSVRVIGNSSFNSSAINNFNFPALTSIGTNAFSNCPLLKNVNLKSSQLLSINTNAFAGSGLTSITISPAITLIDASACANCSSLNRVLFDQDGNYELRSIGDNAFYNCSSLISFYMDTSSNSNAFAKLTAIGYNVFYKCYSITSFVIPINVSSFYDFGFRDITALKTLTIQGQKFVTNPILGTLPAASLYPAFTTTFTTGYSASNATSSSIFITNGITQVTFGPDVTNIPAGYFGYSNNQGITSYFSNINSITGINISTIGNNSFGGCIGLVSFYANSLSTIGYNAFDGCTSLSFTIPPSPITIPPSPITIQSNSLYAVKNITINNESILNTSGVSTNGTSMKTIRSYSTNITIGSNITSIGTTGGLTAFSEISNIPNLKNIYFSLPSAVTYIGENALSNIQSLTNIMIPNSVTKIEKSAFKNCPLLTIVTFACPKLSFIGDTILNGCTSLKNVVLPLSPFTMPKLSTMKVDLYGSDKLDLSINYMYFSDTSSDFFNIDGNPISSSLKTIVDASNILPPFNSSTTTSIPVTVNTRTINVLVNKNYIASEYSLGGTLDIARILSSGTSSNSRYFKNGSPLNFAAAATFSMVQKLPTTSNSITVIITNSDATANYFGYVYDSSNNSNSFIYYPAAPLASGNLYTFNGLSPNKRYNCYLSANYGTPSPIFSGLNFNTSNYAPIPTLLSVTYDGTIFTITLGISYGSTDPSINFLFNLSTSAYPKPQIPDNFSDAPTLTGSPKSFGTVDIKLSETVTTLSFTQNKYTIPKPPPGNSYYFYAITRNMSQYSTSMLKTIAIPSAPTLISLISSTPNTITFNITQPPEATGIYYTFTNAGKNFSGYFLGTGQKTIYSLSSNTMYSITFYSYFNYSVNGVTYYDPPNSILSVPSTVVPFYTTPDQITDLVQDFIIDTSNNYLFAGNTTITSIGISFTQPRGTEELILTAFITPYYLVTSKSTYGTYYNLNTADFYGKDLSSGLNGNKITATLELSSFTTGQGGVFPQNLIRPGSSYSLYISATANSNGYTSSSSKVIVFTRPDTPRFQQNNETTTTSSSTSKTYIGFNFTNESPPLFYDYTGGIASTGINTYSLTNIDNNSPKPLNMYFPLYDSSRNATISVVQRTTYQGLAGNAIYSNFYFTTAYPQSINLSENTYENVGMRVISDVSQIIMNTYKFTVSDLTTAPSPITTLTVSSATINGNIICGFSQPTEFYTAPNYAVVNGTTYARVAEITSFTANIIDPDNIIYKYSVGKFDLLFPTLPAGIGQIIFTLPLSSFIPTLTIKNKTGYSMYMTASNRGGSSGKPSTLTPLTFSYPNQNARQISNISTTTSIGFTFDNPEITGFYWAIGSAPPTNTNLITYNNTQTIISGTTFGTPGTKYEIHFIVNAYNSYSGSLTTLDFSQNLYTAPNAITSVEQNTTIVKTTLVTTETAAGFTIAAPIPAPTGYAYKMLTTTSPFIDLGASNSAKILPTQQNSSFDVYFYAYSGTSAYPIYSAYFLKTLYTIPANIGSISQIGATMTSVNLSISQVSPPPTGYFYRKRVTDPARTNIPRDNIGNILITVNSSGNPLTVNSSSTFYFDTYFGNFEGNTAAAASSTFFYSALSTEFTFFTTPNAPTNLTQTGQTLNSVTMTGTGVTGYGYRLTTPPSANYFFSAGTSVNITEITSYTPTSYDFVAYNGNNKIISATSTKMIYPTPYAPTYLSQTATTTSVSFTLTLTQGSPQPSGYAYKYDNAQTYTDMSKNLDMNRQLNFTVPGLGPNTKYSFSFVSYNSTFVSNNFSIAINQDLFTAPSTPSISRVEPTARTAKFTIIGDAFGGFGYSTLLNGPFTGFVANPFTIDNLTPKSSYTYYFVAYGYLDGNTGKYPSLVSSAVTFTTYPESPNQPVSVVQTYTTTTTSSVPFTITDVQSPLPNGYAYRTATPTGVYFPLVSPFQKTGSSIISNNTYYIAAYNGTLNVINRPNGNTYECAFSTDLQFDFYYLPNDVIRVTQNFQSTTTTSVNFTIDVPTGGAMGYAYKSALTTNPYIDLPSSNTSLTIPASTTSIVCYFYAYNGNSPNRLYSSKPFNFTLYTTPASITNIFQSSATTTSVGLTFTPESLTYAYRTTVNGVYSNANFNNNVISNLSPNTSYTYYFAAYNGLLNAGIFSATDLSFTFYTVPSTIASINPIYPSTINSSVSFSFTQPTGTTTITSYDAYIGTSQTTSNNFYKYTSVTTTGSSTITCSNLPLTSFTSFSYNTNNPCYLYVIANNPGGSSSAPVSATSIYPSPNSPSFFSQTATTSSITFTLTAPTPSPTGYAYKFGSALIYTSISSLPFTVTTGISANTSYSFSFVSYNSALNNFSTAITQILYSAPNNITSAPVTEITSSSARVTVAAPPGGASGYGYSDSSAGPFTYFSATFTLFTDLSSGTSFDKWFVAYSYYNSAAGTGVPSLNPLKVTFLTLPTAPNAPIIVTQSPTGTTTTSVGFTIEPQTPTPTGYAYKLLTTDAAYTPLTLTGNYYQIAGLSNPNTKYMYNIYAYNGPTTNRVYSSNYLIFNAYTVPSAINDLSFNYDGTFSLSCNFTPSGSERCDFFFVYSIYGTTNWSVPDLLGTGTPAGTKMTFTFITRFLPNDMAYNAYIYAKNAINTSIVGAIGATTTFYTLPSMPQFIFQKDAATTVFYSTTSQIVFVRIRIPYPDSSFGINPGAIGGFYHYSSVSQTGGKETIIPIGGANINKIDCINNILLLPCNSYNFYLRTYIGNVTNISPIYLLQDTAYTAPLIISSISFIPMVGNVTTVDFSFNYTIYADAKTLPVFTAFLEENSITNPLTAWTFSAGNYQFVRESYDGVYQYTDDNNSIYLPISPPYSDTGTVGSPRVYGRTYTISNLKITNFKSYATKQPPNLYLVKSPATYYTLWVVAMNNDTVCYPLSSIPSLVFSTAPEPPIKAIFDNCYNKVVVRFYSDSAGTILYNPTNPKTGTQPIYLSFSLFINGSLYPNFNIASVTGQGTALVITTNNNYFLPGTNNYLVVKYNLGTSYSSPFTSTLFTIPYAYPAPNIQQLSIANISHKDPRGIYDNYINSYNITAANSATFYFVSYIEDNPSIIASYVYYYSTSDKTGYLLDSYDGTNALDSNFNQPYEGKLIYNASTPTVGNNSGLTFPATLIAAGKFPTTPLYIYGFDFNYYAAPNNQITIYRPSSRILYLQKVYYYLNNVVLAKGTLSVDIIFTNNTTAITSVASFISNFSAIDIYIYTDSMYKFFNVLLYSREFSSASNSYSSYNSAFKLAYSSNKITLTMEVDKANISFLTSSLTYASINASLYSVNKGPAAIDLSCTFNSGAGGNISSIKF